jgi:hypothetical protein
MKQFSSRSTKAKQYQFNLMIKEAEIEYTSTFNFKLLLKRGNKQIESKNTYKYEMSKRRTVEICEEMNLISIFTYTDDGNLKDKQYKLFLQVYTKTGFKNAAYTDINLLSFIDQNNAGIELEFKKHPFIYLKIKATITSKFLMDVDLKDSINDMSRLSDNDDDLNMSIASSRKPEPNTTQDSKSISEEAEARISRKSVQVNTNSGSEKVVTESILDKKNEQDTKTLQELHNKIVELSKRIEALQNENSELKLKVKEKANRSNAGMLDDDEKDRMIDELKTENDYFEQQIDQLKSIIADLKAEKTKVYEEKIKSIKALNEELDQLKEKNDIFERSNKKLTKEKSEVDEKLQILNQTINDLNTRIVHNE